MVSVHVRRKGFMDFFQETDADIFCIQETKMQEGQLELDTPGYRSTGIMRRKKVIRGSNIYQAGTNQRKLRTWNRGARPGRACDRVGLKIFTLLPCIHQTPRASLQDWIIV